MASLLNDQSVIKKWADWSKLFLPASFLKYYPPAFVLRHPTAHVIKRLVNQGRQACVLVFYIENERELSNRFGYEAWDTHIKDAFKTAIKNHVPNQHFLSLNHYLSDTMSAIIQLDEEIHCISQIEVYIKNINSHVREQLPDISIKTGYMFIDHTSHSIEESIYRAHQQALVMAEKHQESQYAEMRFDIQRIIDEKKIMLLAQPIINVESKQTVAWEMLTRGPANTPYESPLSLFSLARQTNLLYPLEMLVVEQAFQNIVDTNCKQLVFINLTVMTIGSSQLIKDIENLLEKYHLINPSQIIFEITERESIDTAQNLSVNIEELRKFGFRIAVDDTGAGYASLHTISQVMPDIIKIDRSVIQDIDSNRVKESMLKGLLLIAKEAGSLVVAEGIETREEAAVLSKNKVDLAQGYYYARPNSTALMMT